MKITPQDYQELKALLTPLAPKLAAHRENLRNHAKFNDLEKRLRWDWLWFSDSKNWVNKVYKYANDEHIDTALKRAMAEIGNLT